jgi:diguanylate cyclase (GGDEF)-like protein
MQSTTKILHWSQKDDIFRGYIINEYGFKHETPYEIHNEPGKGFFCAYEVCQITQTKKPLPIEPNENLDELIRSVQNFYIKQAQLEEEYFLFHDTLTRIYQPRYLKEFLANQVQIARVYDHSLSLIYIDINNFRDINDHFGMSDGDSAIILLTSIIQNTIGPSDVLGRWGGDEFMVIMPETELSVAESIAKKIKKVANSHIFHSSYSTNVDFHLSISVAACCLQELELKVPDEFLRLAEERMQKAKYEMAKVA